MPQPWYLEQFGMRQRCGVAAARGATGSVVPT